MHYSTSSNPCGNLFQPKKKEGKAHSSKGSRFMQNGEDECEVVESSGSQDSVPPAEVKE